MPKEYPPINEISLCKTCYGCGQLENPRFAGVVKCKNYKLGYPEHYKAMQKDYGASVDAEGNKNNGD